MGKTKLQKAAGLLSGIKSEKKSEAARRNGALGGRPKKANSNEAKRPA